MKPNKLKPKNINYVVAALLFVFVGILGSIYYLFFFNKPQPQPLKIAEISGSSLPITGTFFWDVAEFNEQQLEAYFAEAKAMGIDTLVSGAALGMLSGKNPDGTFKKIPLLSDAAVIQILKLTKRYNIKMYWDLTYNDWQTVPYWEGNPEDINTAMGAAIAYRKEMLENFKNLVSQSGISWNDPIIAGIYIPEEAHLGQLAAKETLYNFYLNEIPKLKLLIGNDKKIIISNYQFESHDYNTSYQAYLNLYSIDGVDIIAPQDSMGGIDKLNCTQCTNTYSRSSDHYRALRDAVNTYPEKEAWANIESFRDHRLKAEIFYNPTTIERLVNQIEAARPYVDKIIIFTYEHHLLSDSIFDNATYSRERNQYIPSQAILRRQLRAHYLKHYTSGNSSFTDVPATHPYKIFISDLKNAGIISGCTATTFCPDQALTRAQAAIVLLRTKHGPSYTPPSASSTFTDTTTHWAKDWIEALKAAGITSGCTATTFCPDQALTRAQFSVLLLKTKHGPSYTPPSASSTFTDTTTHWAKDWIEAIKEESTISGCGNLSFCPEGEVTRAEMSSMLLRTFPNLESSIATPTPYPTPPQLPSSNPSPSLTTNQKPGDLDGDGFVNYVDFNLLITSFGNPYTIVDFNNIVSNYGK